MSNDKQREPELGAVATVVCAICHKRTSHYRRYQGSDYCPDCYETFVCSHPEAAAPAQPTHDMGGSDAFHDWPAELAAPAPVLTQPSDEQCPTCRSPEKSRRFSISVYNHQACGFSATVCNDSWHESERPVLPNYAEIQEFVAAELGHANTTVVSCIQKWEMRARASSPAVASTRNEILQEALDACGQFDRTVEVRKCMDKIRALQVAAPAIAGRMRVHLEKEYKKWIDTVPNEWQQTPAGTQATIRWWKETALKLQAALRESAREAPSECKHKVSCVVSWNWSPGNPTLTIQCGSCGNEIYADFSPSQLLKVAEELREASPEAPAAPKEK